jgi:hypothetical protein
MILMEARRNDPGTNRGQRDQVLDVREREREKEREREREEQSREKREGERDRPVISKQPL